MHLGYLYALLARRDPSECISHKRMPTWWEHERFWQECPYKESYMVERLGGPIGMCYITHANEIGAHLDERSYRRAVIKHLLRTHPGTRMLLNVGTCDSWLQEDAVGIGMRQCQVTYEYTWPMG